MQESEEPVVDASQKSEVGESKVTSDAAGC